MHKQIFSFLSINRLICDLKNNMDSSHKELWFVKAYGYKYSQKYTAKSSFFKVIILSKLVNTFFSIHNIINV